MVEHPPPCICETRTYTMGLLPHHGLLYDTSPKFAIPPVSFYSLCCIYMLCMVSYTAFFVPGGKKRPGACCGLAKNPPALETLGEPNPTQGDYIMEERAEYKTKYGRTLGLSCGVDRCVHNHNRRCVLEKISLDFTGKCTSYMGEPLTKSFVTLRKKMRKRQLERLLVDAFVCEMHLKHLDKRISTKICERRGLENLGD